MFSFLFIRLLLNSWYILIILALFHCENHLLMLLVVSEGFHYALLRVRLSLYTFSQDFYFRTQCPSKGYLWKGVWSSLKVLNFRAPAWHRTYINLDTYVYVANIEHICFPKNDMIFIIIVSIFITGRICIRYSILVEILENSHYYLNRSVGQCVLQLFHHSLFLFGYMINITEGKRLKWVNNSLYKGWRHQREHCDRNGVYDLRSI